MSGSRALGIVAVVLVASALAVGCAPTEPDAGRDESDAQRGPGNDAAMAPTLTAIGNLTFAGIEDGPVTLVDGLWEGAPFAPGGASRPSVGLAEDFQISGDLDGDGAPETVVVLWQSSGGSGTFDYLAVVGRRRAALVNLGTAPLGDRVQIRDARVEGTNVVLDLVQQGPGDAACCPTQKTTRRWSLTSAGLVEGEPVVEGTISTHDLENVTWRLVRLGETAPPESLEVTLTFAGNRIAGQGPCNRYFADFAEGGTATALEIGAAIGSTRMACAEPVMAFEHAYFDALAGVRSFGFSLERLVLASRRDGAISTLLFAAQGEP